MQAIPEEIVVMVTEMKVGDRLAMSELPMPDGARLLDDAEAAVAIVRMVAEEEVPPVEEEAAAEPEVIGEPKEAEGEQPPAEE